MLMVRLKGRGLRFIRDRPTAMPCMSNCEPLRKKPRPPVWQRRWSYPRGSSLSKEGETARTSGLCGADRRATWCSHHQGQVADGASKQAAAKKVYEPTQSRSRLPERETCGRVV